MVHRIWSRKKAVSCRGVYTVKLYLDGSLACLKACLVTKGYSQMYSIDYKETFSPMANLTSAYLFIIHQWLLHQLDINNAFLHGILDEDVYMEKSSSFVAQVESGQVCRLSMYI